MGVFWLLRLLALCLLTLTGLCQSQRVQLLEYSIPEGPRDLSYIASISYDAGLGEQYGLSQLQSLQFSVLRVSPLSSDFFTFKNLGELHQTRDLDRDSICPQQEDCYIYLDIGIKPVEYFQLIKVRISLLDINDNSPEFPQEEITVHISEMTSPGAVFAFPAAEDTDAGNNAVHRYSLMTKTNKFELKVRGDAESGTESENLKLVLKRRLDHEDTHFYLLKVVAWDNGTPQKSGSVMINIQVGDVNDNNPVFDNTSLTVTVTENVAVDTSIAQLHATDQDKGDNGKVLYSFSKVTQESYGDIFRVDGQSGHIVVTGEVDYEIKSQYSLTVVAQDAGVSPLSAYAKVIVQVEDVNDHPPQVTTNAMTADGLTQIKENSPPGTFVAHISVLDPDLGSNGQVSCVLDSRDFELQKLYSTELKLVSKTTFDREINSEYNLSISCKDGGDPALYSMTPISVVITDDNDNDPQFVMDSYEMVIQENNVIGAYITQLNATDLDIGQNANISYILQAWESSLFLQLEPNSGMVTARVQFDREVNKRYEFVVIAQDGGRPQRSSSATLTLTIEDVNDEPPQFAEKKYVFGSYENQDVGTEIGTIQAFDLDSSPHNNIVYDLDSESPDASLFHVDSKSGKITTKQVLDRELQEDLHITLLARDPDNSDLQGSTKVTILVADRNDNAPILIFPNAINNTVEILGLPRAGDVIAQIEAYDFDLGVNSALTYMLRSGDNDDVFEVNSRLGTVELSKDLRDYSGMLFELVILVQDDGDEKLSTVETLNVFVNNSAAVAAATAMTSHLDYRSTLLILSLTLLPLVIIALALVLLYTWRRHRERQSQNRKYNCRVEAARALAEVNISKEKHTNTDDLRGDAIYKGYDAEKGSGDVRYDVIDNRNYKEVTLWLESASPVPLIQSPQANSTMVNMGSASTTPCRSAYCNVRYPTVSQYQGGRCGKLDWHDLQRSFPRSFQRSSSGSDTDEGQSEDTFPQPDECQRVRDQWRAGRYDWTQYLLHQEQAKKARDSDHNVSKCSSPDADRSSTDARNRASLTDSGHGHSEESDQLIAMPQLDETDTQMPHPQDSSTPFIKRPAVSCRQAPRATSDDSSSESDTLSPSSTNSTLSTPQHPLPRLSTFCSGGAKPSHSNNRARRALTFSERERHRPGFQGNQQPIEMQVSSPESSVWSESCPNDSLYPPQITPTYYQFHGPYSPPRGAHGEAEKSNCTCLSNPAVTDCIHKTVRHYIPDSTLASHANTDTLDHSSLSSESSQSSTWMCYSDVVV